MFGIVICASCSRKRIADLAPETSTCPYCGTASRTSELTVAYSNASQDIVRKAFNNIDSSKYRGSDRKNKDPDPMSTLMYHYEHTSDVRGKLFVLANGLTKLKGSFNEGDIEELFPGKGEKMMKMMMSGEIIIESADGKFKAL
jgi:hypothetical protein